jgi:hypothetical protein
VQNLDFLKNFPDYKFIAGRFFMWSPRNRTITYDPKRLKTNNGRIAVLHEIGHASLGHRHYKYDMQLLKMEMDAWDFVRHTAPGFGIKIDEEHITRCIASYDQWLSKRATCPDCQAFSLQKDRFNFGCFSCGSKWQVNMRIDRRVKRTVTSRYGHPHLAVN